MLLTRCIILLFFSASAFANTIKCPSVNEIKNHQFNGWLPLYIEGEELASRADVDKFKNNVTDFEVARWAHIYLENGHCFYRGTDPIVEKITFAQDAWRPVEYPTWSWTIPNRLAECYTLNVDDCEFIT